MVTFSHGGGGEGCGAGSAEASRTCSSIPADSISSAQVQRQHVRLMPVRDGADGAPSTALLSPAAVGLMSGHSAGPCGSWRVWEGTIGRLSAASGHWTLSPEEPTAPRGQSSLSCAQGAQAWVGTAGASYLRPLLPSSCHSAPATWVRSRAGQGMGLVERPTQWVRQEAQYLQLVVKSEEETHRAVKGASRGPLTWRTPLMRRSWWVFLGIPGPRPLWGSRNASRAGVPGDRAPRTSRILHGGGASLFADELPWRASLCPPWSLGAGQAPLT